MKKQVHFEGVGFLFAVTGLLKVVWNYVCPEVFGLKKISYKQSVLLYILFKALFGASNIIKDSFKVDQSCTNNTGSKDDAKEKKAVKKEEKPVEKKDENKEVDVDIESIEEVEETEEIKLEDAVVEEA